jgi:hypothetical protein
MALSVHDPKNERPQVCRTLVGLHTAEVFDNAANFKAISLNQDTSMIFSSLRIFFSFESSFRAKNLTNLHCFFLLFHFGNPVNAL